MAPWPRTCLLHIATSCAHVWADPYDLPRKYEVICHVCTAEDWTGKRAITSFPSLLHPSTRPRRFCRRRWEKGMQNRKGMGETADQFCSSSKHKLWERHFTTYQNMSASPSFLKIFVLIQFLWKTLLVKAHCWHFIVKETNSENFSFPSFYS